MPLPFDPGRIDWNLLRAFTAVLEQGSLTRAAERLGSSQPTLSRQIAALEAQAGAPLFERAARRLVPTALGQALAEPAARMLAAAQAMAQAAEGAARGLRGSVRITASEVVSTQVLPPLLLQLAQAHPEIQVELVASDRVDNLLQREADIAVRMLRPTQGGVLTRHLADWPLGFFVHRDALAAAGGPPDRTTLQRFRWLGFDQSSQLIDGFRAAGMDVDRDFFAFRCDHQPALYAALCAGLGVGVALVPLARRQPQLVQVLGDEVLPSLPVWLTARQELRANRRLRTVFDFLANGLLRWGESPASPRRTARH